MLLALLIAGSLHAQKADYAVHSTTTSSYSTTNIRIGAVIQIRARSERQAMLHWAPFREGVSHYVLERSIDGRQYAEAGVFFTGEWGNEPDYFFTDKFGRPYTGPLFYRLRVVGVDGSEVYSLPSICEPQRGQ